MSKTTIYEEIRDLLDTYNSLFNLKPSKLYDFKNLCDEIRLENQHKANEGLQPWLGIFEFSLQWLVSLHMGLNRENDVVPINTLQHRIQWALLGSACSFGFSIRNLCIDGFDVPAKALLRSYTESLFLSVAILFDEKLANEYQNAIDEEKIKTFWHTSASPKNLHKRLLTIEKEIGLDAEFIEKVKSWRIQEYSLLSEAAHLSYTLACMSVLTPALDETCKYAVFGKTSKMSLRTISYAAHITWYYSMLIQKKLFKIQDIDDGLLVINPKNIFHKSILLKHEILKRLIIKYWNKDDHSV